MPVYPFDLGNSDTGSLGCVVRVHARNNVDALRILQSSLSPTEEITPKQRLHDEIEDIVVFVNPDFITTENILTSEIESCERHECRACGAFQDVAENVA